MCWVQGPQTRGHEWWWGSRGKLVSFRVCLTVMALIGPDCDPPQSADSSSWGACRPVSTRVGHFLPLYWVQITPNFGLSAGKFPPHNHRSSGESSQLDSSVSGPHFPVLRSGEESTGGLLDPQSLVSPYPAGQQTISLEWETWWGSEAKLCVGLEYDSDRTEKVQVTLRGQHLVWEFGFIWVHHQGSCASGKCSCLL